jgi:hypothetical protein
MLSRCSLACVIALGLLAPAAGQQKPPAQPSMADGAAKLEWKFKEKDKFYVETWVSWSQIRRTQGSLQELRDEVRVSTLSSFTVRKVDSDGSVQLDQKIEGTNYTWGPAASGNAALAAELFGKLQGATFRITLGPDRKVGKFEGYDDLARRIEQANPGEGERFRALVPEDDLRSATEDGFAFLPEKEVRTGESWERPMHLNLLPFGTLSSNLVYTFESVKDNKAKITSTFRGSSFAAGGKIPQVKADFKLENRSGTTQFDVPKGRPLQSDFTIRYKGTLTPTAVTQGAGGLMEVFVQQTVRIMVRDRMR